MLHIIPSFGLKHGVKQTRNVSWYPLIWLKHGVKQSEECLKNPFLAEAFLAPDALVGPVGAVADAVAEVADVDAILLPLGIALHGGILASAIFRYFRTVLLIFEKVNRVGFLKDSSFVSSHVKRSLFTKLGR